MNEWFKKIFATIKEKWAKWTAVQKGIVIGIIVVVVGAIILTATLSSRPTTVRLYDTPVTDETERSTIIQRLNQDGIKVYDDPTQHYLSVDNEEIAKKYRSVIVAEGIEPSKVDPYSLFDTSSWSRTDFNNKVDWLNATEKAVTNHIMQLDGIKRADVKLTLPDTETFQSDQKPVTASVILYAKAGNDVLQDKKQVKSIVHLIMRSVEGLTEDNITILDGITHREINDFTSTEASDKIDITAKQQNLISKLEDEYTNKVIDSLKFTYGTRVQVANMKIEMDQSDIHSTAKEYGGITIKPDNPNTVYDDSEIVPSLVQSSETIDKKSTGTGYNPEGPAGTTGQNPPVYSDMSNVIGQQTESSAKTNYALNEKNITEDKSPSIDRVSFSVNIDSQWGAPQYDAANAENYYRDHGYYERPEIKIPAEELSSVTKLVQNAVGYDKGRGDSVVVTNIGVDHSAEYRTIDLAYKKAQQTKKTILFILIGIAVVLIAFVLFRFISREVERRRRLREEELLRKQQAAREQALWDAKEQGMEVTMSVEERHRAELQENAIAMAKEHPEDVAMLIRTWLMEE
jgi:flagellar M-ring protein FliF